ncbi:Thioredoxin reductase 2 [Dictyocoela muelleri]|nr:Thioredoxin reductase 2 [Dictyocoela muelleri]
MDDIADIAIVGSGPAAYSAVLYSYPNKILLFEGKIIGNNGPGGQLTTTTNVDNYPGFPNRISGPALVKSMQNHVKDKCVVVSETVQHVQKISINNSEIESMSNSMENTSMTNSSKELFLIHAGNNAYKALTVIIATGAQARRLFVEGTRDNEFWQRGISACAVCDGWAYKDMTVSVLGGGDTAMEETQYLAGIAKKVYLIHRRNQFRSRDDLLQKVKNLSNVEIMTPFTLVSAHGNEFLESIKLINTENGEIKELKTDGFFFAIGHDPNSQMVDEKICDDSKYIETKNGGVTEVEGLFACGDVQDKKYCQAITAAASGCEAAISACSYLRKIK